MDREQISTGAALSLEQLKRAYDAEVRNFLSEKQILARIMKRCVKEFQDCSVDDIAEKYIEGVPQTGVAAVDQDVPDAVQMHAGSRISGSANEDFSTVEGRVFYDVKFNAAAPGTGGLIRLIINVEAQRANNPGYPIIKRGLYYGARLLSSQKNREFKNDNYQDIEKVYSIWICQQVPALRQHSIFSYDIREQMLHGYAETPREKPENYDLMTVILVNLGDPERQDTDGLLRMLSTALSSKLSLTRKKQILSDEFHIPMTETIDRRMRGMCNFSDGIEQDAMEKGIRQGVQQGTLHTLYSLVQKQILSVSDAAAEAEQSVGEFQTGMAGWAAAAK